MAKPVIAPLFLIVIGLGWLLSVKQVLPTVNWIWVLMLGTAGISILVVKRITRCAAVNVDPETAARDLSIPNELMRRLGHNECGVYAEVIAGGTIAAGDTIATEEPQLL